MVFCRSYLICIGQLNFANFFELSYLSVKKNRFKLFSTIRLSFRIRSVNIELSAFIALCKLEMQSVVAAVIFSIFVLLHVAYGLRCISHKNCGENAACITVNATDKAGKCMCFVGYHGNGLICVGNQTFQS